MKQDVHLTPATLVPEATQVCYNAKFCEYFPIFFHFARKGTEKSE